MTLPSTEWKHPIGYRDVVQVDPRAASGVRSRGAPGAARVG